MKKKTLLLCLLSAGMMWTPAVTAVAGVHANMAVAAPDDQVITGTVEDASGPMIGATVKVVGSSVGAVTDLDGKF